MERLRYDLRWKVAVGVPLDHKGYHPTRLVRFPGAIAPARDGALALGGSTRLAVELVLMEGQVEQIVDSTPMLGAAATQDTARLVRSGVRKLIDAVGARDGEAAGRLRRGLVFDDARPRQKPDGEWRSTPARARMLSEVATDAERALRAVEEAGLLDAPDVAEAFRLLREIVGQDLVVDQDDVPRLRRGVAPGRILSVVDPEMGHGRKSGAVRFDGDKIHAAGRPTPPSSPPCR